ncbi:MAG TPA: helix-turn-helix domain-containing protein [Thermoleophilaceae bacterium]|nr:helix-turn-helix domain-containing protein [Thermoleophilaceae bacterium]
MNTTKRYSMELRAAAAEATRERILSAAHELFLERWYDDVTLAVIAERAGVSVQTVINHFGGKEGLFTGVQERFGRDVGDLRYSATPGDVDSIVGVLLDDYERTGDAVIRLLALEEKVPSVAPMLAVGRRGHREWVEAMFGAPEVTAELVVATDVYTWKLLRRDQGLSRKRTAASMRRLIQGILERRTR